LAYPDFNEPSIFHTRRQQNTARRRHFSQVKPIAFTPETQSTHNHRTRVVINWLLKEFRNILLGSSHRSLDHENLTYKIQFRSRNAMVFIEEYSPDPIYQRRK
jgi:hypothetical protein